MKRVSNELAGGKLSGTSFDRCQIKQGGLFYNRLICLKWHRDAHRAAVKALESGGSLSVVIRRIEEAMSSG
ncbi:hypothetical protein NC652_022385 [Populus alba x Populus x berolinensis]|nr:hypothetical protein NC652_022385 [Populus alba x Populus x berolinensis]